MVSSKLSKFWIVWTFLVKQIDTNRWKEKIIIIILLQGRFLELEVFWVELLLYISAIESCLKNARWPFAKDGIELVLDNLLTYDRESGHEENEL